MTVFLGFHWNFKFCKLDNYLGFYKVLTELKRSSCGSVYNVGIIVDKFSQSRYTVNLTNWQIFWKKYLIWVSLGIVIFSFIPQFPSLFTCLFGNEICPLTPSSSCQPLSPHIIKRNPSMVPPLHISLYFLFKKLPQLIVDGLGLAVLQVAFGTCCSPKWTSLDCPKFQATIYLFLY